MKLPFSLMAWLFVLFLCCLSGAQLYAQVGINILDPDTSAILHLESTDRGFLPPRMNTSQRDNIVSPKPGLTIYNTEDSIMQYYNGDCWLYAWQRNCTDCAFDFGIQNQIGNIDRIYTEADSTELYINQLVGTPQTIAVYVIPNLPDGITATLNNAVVNGSDTIMLTVEASLFAPPGQYPVIVQAVCGNTIGSQVFVVTVEPCIEVDIFTPQIDYDLQAANGISSTDPVCVVTRISPGIVLTSGAGNPAFTTGALHPDSRVGILNEGDILGKGGDGGAGSGLIGGGSGEGADGMHALDMTVYTHLINTGHVFGGGGGGGSVGWVETIPVINFSLGIGAGGGGGAADGIGGNLGLGLGYYEAGSDAGTGFTAAAGDGGELVTPISFSVAGIADVTLTPNVFGGDGGEFGMDGDEGTLFVNIRLTTSIPFVGTITLLDQDIPDPPPTGFPDGGDAGFAVKRNGNTLNGVVDGNYQTLNIKGEVGN